MNYFTKFLKYKEKYNNFVGGSKIDNIQDIFNANFGNKWILTGSEAIKKYLEYCNIKGFDFPTNDVDIFYITKSSLTSPTISGYTRQQSQPERSMTFIKPDPTVQSFDVTLVPAANYYEYNGLRLDTPQHMLENYEENISLRNNDYDQIKINALREIITKVRPGEIIPIVRPEDMKTLKPDIPLPIGSPDGPRRGLSREDFEPDSGIPNPPSARRGLSMADLDAASSTPIRKSLF